MVRMTDPKQRLIVGISGASGVIYGVRLLEALQTMPVETHLVMTRTAEVTLAHETDLKVAAVRKLADVAYKVDDLAAAISSGSFRTMGMVVAPCSMRSLGEIAHGLSSNLLTRAADVILKERKRLVLVARETPLTAIHLRNMLTLSEMGAIVAPPVPAFYNRPKSLDDVVDHTVGRLLDLFGLDTGKVKRWKSPQ
jgi:4-hydroxy-3-polyprenylbenzoate decarboxylase